VSVDLRAGRVHVVGELDRGSAHHLLDALGALSLTGHPAWTVDGAGITFCDATGLRALARARVLAAGRGRTLRVVGLRPFLASLVEMAGLGSLLPEAPGSGQAAPQSSRRCGTTP
jgi:anti-anti-sigma factor